MKISEAFKSLFIQKGYYREYLSLDEQLHTLNRARVSGVTDIDDIISAKREELENLETEMIAILEDNFFKQLVRIILEDVYNSNKETEQ